MNLQVIEDRLARSLEADRKHKSRLHPGNDNEIVVTPSGTSVGLAIAISQMTGEPTEAIMDRVGNRGTTS